MMFLSLGLGTAAAVILITVVSLLTGGANESVFTHQAPDGQHVGAFTLPGLSGSSLTMPWASGHPTVVVLFASWCEPCKEELPRVANFVRTTDLGTVRVIGVDVNDTRGAGLAFASHAQVGFRVAFDTANTTTSAFLLGGLPDTVFVNSTGVVAQVVVGPVSNRQLAVGISELR